MKESLLNKKSLLVVLLIIAVVLVGFVYFYSGAILPTYPQTLSVPETSTVPESPECICGWNNNYECGGVLDCRITDGTIPSWEKICECNPSGCGSKCGDFQEGTLACTPDTC